MPDFLVDLLRAADRLRDLSTHQFAIPLPQPADAVLFNYTHDVLQSACALERIFSFARPGARIAIAGIKHPPAMLFPLRLYRLIKARPYVSTLRGLDRPWRLLSGYVTDLRVEQVMLGTNYLACGTARK